MMKGTIIINLHVQVHVVKIFYDFNFWDFYKNSRNGRN